MTTNEDPGTDRIVELIGRTVAAYFTEVTGRTEPEAGDLDLAFDIRSALVNAGWGDLHSLAGTFTARADTHDKVADRWTSEDREQALIDSGIAAGYRGAAELTLKPITATTVAAKSTPAAQALETITSVLNQWEHGSLINKEGEGIVWIEPLWPLPRRTEEIRSALAVLQSAHGTDGA